MSKKHETSHESINASTAQENNTANLPAGFKAPKNWELLPSELQNELLENWKIAQTEIDSYKEFILAEQAKVKEQAVAIKAEEKAEKEKARLMKTAERTARAAKVQALRAVDRMKEQVENMKVRFSVPDIFAKKIQVRAKKQQPAGEGQSEFFYGVITGMTRGADSQVFYRISYLTSDGILAGFHKKFAGIQVLENNDECQAVYEKIHSK